MNLNDNIPFGADQDSRAPWHQEAPSYYIADILHSDYDGVDLTIRDNNNPNYEEIFHLDAEKLLETLNLD
jgi:hypothetical protein